MTTTTNATNATNNSETGHGETASVRPRIEGDREAEILVAALEVLTDVGYDRFTMDAVAQRARASKATLYRRWNNKVSLIIEALQHGHHDGGTDHQQVPDTGSLRRDLIAGFCSEGGLTDKPEVDTFGAILTAIMRDRAFAEAFRRDVLAPKLAGTTAIFDRAKARGEIHPDVDIELLAPALAGIVMHRFVLVGEPPTEDLITRVIDQIILPATGPVGQPSTTSKDQ